MTGPMNAAVNGRMKAGLQMPDIQVGAPVELIMPGIAFRGHVLSDNGEMLEIRWDDGKHTLEFPADLKVLDA